MGLWLGLKTENLTWATFHFDAIPNIHHAIAALGHVHSRTTNNGVMVMQDEMDDPFMAMAYGRAKQAGITREQFWGILIRGAMTPENALLQ